METNELKPCPFCGSEPEEKVHNRGLMVTCTECHAAVWRGVMVMAEFDRAAESCRQAWNERV